MLVNYYADYLAYTFEANDSMFMLGMRLVNKSKDDTMSAVDVMHNDRLRLLYGIEGYKTLSEVVETLNNSELAIALIKFIRSIRKIEDNDFIKITAIDINFNRLYYDVKKKAIKYVILPINYECDFHDGEKWSSSFRKTLLIILNSVFSSMPEKYSEVYYVIMDETKTDYEILDYLDKYEFGLQSEENSYTTPILEEETGASLVLEHRGADGNYIFMVNKQDFVMGKSKTVDGTIPNSTMVSRNHCKITKVGNRYMVEDLGSTNHTSLNGYILNPNEPYYINNGDKLALADVEFTAILE